MMASVRRGFVLPLAMLSMVIVMLVIGSLQFASWRALQSTRVQWEAQDALYASNAAVVTAIATWDPLAVAQQPIGATRWTSVVVRGWRTETGIARTAPLVAVVTAHTVSNANPSRIRRAVTRIVHLTPPYRPDAAVTSMDSLVVDGATVDGHDVASPVDPPRDDCGPIRDTASVAPVHRVAPPMRAVARASFDIAWDTTVRRTTRLVLNADGSVTQSMAWQPVRLAGDSGAVTLDGNSRLQGVLLVDGDLRVRGQLRLDGLLVVRGALLVDAGELHVDGAVIVRDSRGVGSTLGARSSVRWAPCLMARAQAAVASPQRGPFHQWHSP